MYARHSNTLTFTCKPNRYSTSKAAVFLTFIGFLMYCAYCRVRICKKLASVIGCCALFCSCCYACGIASKMNESCLVPTCLEATGVLAMRIKLRTAYGIQVSGRPAYTLQRHIRALLLGGCGLSSTHDGVCIELMCIFYMYKLYAMMTSRVPLFKGNDHERLLCDVTVLQLRLVSTWPRAGRTRRRCISHSLRISRRRHFESAEIR